MFEFGRELKRIFGAQGGWRPARDGLAGGDSALLELLDLSLLRNEGKAADVAAGRISAKDKPQRRLEAAIAKERGNDGPFFNGPDMCLVDAAYAPFFQRFMLCEEHLKTGLLDDFPLVAAWVDALLATDAVTGSVPPEFPEAFNENLERRGALAWALKTGAQAAE
mgnify:CR=1 FL=1